MGDGVLLMFAAERAKCKLVTPAFDLENF